MNTQKIIEDLWLRDDEELMFMASIIRLVLDDREVPCPSRESEMESNNEK